MPATVFRKWDSTPVATPTADTTGRMPQRILIPWSRFVKGDRNGFASDGTDGTDPTDPLTTPVGGWLRLSQCENPAPTGLGRGFGKDAGPGPLFRITVTPMSERITADLDPRHFADGEFAPVLYHDGDSHAPLARWRELLGHQSPRGWGAVRGYAPDVMTLIAEPKVLFTAASQLRAKGPKSPGPNGIRLGWLDRGELWRLCAALGAALKADTYRPGREKVVWVDKASGSGRRPVVVTDVQDRVVQKAAALVLRPLLDGRFDPLSFAFRPRRSREQALAAAELLTPAHPVWLAHDIQDAFRRVPVPRLLDIVFQWLPCPRLKAFLRRVLPPESRSIGGIKQGGPLSPLMLEVYLTHFLHEPWRRASHPVSLLRYADDLLVVAAERADAESADAALRSLLTPAGMTLKAAFPNAVVDTRDREAEWLGYRCRLVGQELEVRPGVGVLDKLARRFLLAHAKCRPAERANQVLKSWFGQLGPCHRKSDRPALIRRAIASAVGHGFEETPAAADLDEAWGQACIRWRSIRRRLRGTPGYFAPGPLEYPTPTSVAW